MDLLSRPISLVFRTAFLVYTRNVRENVYIVVLLLFNLGLWVKTFQISYGKTLIGFSKVHFTCPEAIRGKFFFFKKTVIFWFFFSLSSKKFRTLAKNNMADLSKLHSKCPLEIFYVNWLLCRINQKIQGPWAERFALLTKFFGKL